MQPQVFCLGSIQVDLIYRVDDPSGFLQAWGTGLRRGGEEALSREEEARLLELLGRFGRQIGRYGGGPAANTAYALARLGIAAALTGRLGDDADGLFIRESLRGVNLNYLTQTGESGRSYVLVDPEGERTSLTAPGTNDDLREEDLPWEAMGQAKFLHLNAFSGDGPLQVQRQLARRLAGGPRLVFDPGELGARRGREALEELLDHAETLLVSEAEWQVLGGETQGHPVWAPPVVLIKRGARGFRLLTPVRYLDILPTFEGRAVETLGAADVLAAGYLAGLMLGLHLPQAVRLAEHAAAYKLGGSGRESYPDKRVLEMIVARLR